MSDIIKNQGDLRTRIQGLVAEIITGLGGQGTKNYNGYLTQLQGVELSMPDKQSLTTALLGDLQKQIERGQFVEIERAREFLNFLGINEFEFNPETAARITELYNQFSYGFLTDMSPILYDDALLGGKKYNSVEYVREMMQKAKIPDTSDEAIDELWRYREILIKLHYNNWKPQGQLGEITKQLLA